MRVQLVATISVTVVLLIGAFVFATHSVRQVGSPVTVVLPRADGVREGTIVTYLGVELGRWRASRSAMAW